MKTLLLLLLWCICLTSANADTRITWKNNSTNVVYCRNVSASWTDWGNVALAPLSEGVSHISEGSWSPWGTEILPFEVGNDAVGWVLYEFDTGSHYYVPTPFDDDPLQAQNFVQWTSPVRVFWRAFGFGITVFAMIILHRMIWRGTQQSA